MSKLITAIVKGTWLIEPQTADAFGPFVASLLSGKNVSLDEKTQYPYNIKVKSDEPETSGTVKVISVKGVLMKDDQYCGPVGMATMGEYIKNAANDPNIDAILLDIDTPGGTVDGTEVFADIIKNTSKPVVGFINGLAASAGMWIASATDKLIASTEHDKVGSIGVMLSFADIQPYWEKMGIKFHEIYSSLSKDKNSDFKKLIDGKYDDYIKDVLDPIAEKFQNTIKENRPGVKENQLTGKTYFAKDVTGTLIDEIGTFEYALSEAIKLAKSNSNSNTQTMSKENNNVDLTTEKGLTAFFKNVFGLKTAEEKAAEKAAVQKAEADKKAKEDAEKAAAEKAEADKKALEEKIAALEKENAELKGSAGAESATVIKVTDGNKDKDPAMIDIPEGVSVEEQFAAFQNALNEAKK